jgi:hypothetical protein
MRQLSAHALGPMQATLKQYRLVVLIQSVTIDNEFSKEVGRSGRVGSVPHLTCISPVRMVFRQPTSYTYSLYLCLSVCVPLWCANFDNTKLQSLPRGSPRALSFSIGPHTSTISVPNDPAASPAAIAASSAGGACSKYKVKLARVYHLFAQDHHLRAFLDEATLELFLLGGCNRDGRRGTASHDRQEEKELVRAIPRKAVAKVKLSELEHASSIAGKLIGKRSFGTEKVRRNIGDASSYMLINPDAYVIRVK